MESIVRHNQEKQREEKERKRLERSLCRISQSLPGNQGHPTLGNGVLMSVERLLHVDERILGAKYFILTTTQVLSEQTLSSLKKGNYELDFRSHDKAKPKRRVRLVEIVQCVRFERGLVYIVLDTSKFKGYCNSPADRTFDKVGTWNGEDTVYCHSVEEDLSSFRVKHCELSGRHWIDQSPNSSLALGSLILNNQGEVLGILGKKSNASGEISYVLNAPNVVVPPVSGADQGGGSNDEQLAHALSGHHREEPSPNASCNNLQSQSSSTNGCVNGDQKDEPSEDEPDNKTDPLVKICVLGCLKLLHALSRCLDGVSIQGAKSCWKELAEELGIPAQIYKSFQYCVGQSPTDWLLDYVTSCTLPELTIQQLNAHLILMERIDVSQILRKYIEEKVITDQDRVASLYNITPDIIGEMCPLLDTTETGVKNWTQLANLLQVPRSVNQGFTSQGNPTEELFKHLCAQQPHLTVRDIKESVCNLKRPDVNEVLKSSTKVTDTSRIKELMEDLDVFEKVCHLLNQPFKFPKKNWYHLGNGFGIKREILDVFSPVDPQTVRGPTENLFQYLGAQQPKLTMSRLAKALDTINRPDALVILDEHGFQTTKLLEYTTSP